MEREKREEGEIVSEYNDEDKKEKAVTFYVSNLHPHITDGELWIECKNYGHIVDAYIARKLDKWKNRFGFLRFVNVKDTDKMVKALNQMNFYGWRIRANVARFVKVEKKTRGKSKVWTEKIQDPVAPVNNERSAPNNGHVKQGTTWADVVSGRPKHQVNVSELRFANESVPLKAWRGSSVIGELHSIEALRGASQMMKDLGVNRAQVRYLGGLKLLVVFDSIEELNLFLKKEDNRKEWFRCISVWNGERIPYERIAWLRIRGVPLQLWIDTVFECIGEKFGKVIKKSDADEKDVCFNEEVIGVLV
ncbi:uncharacterized protein LOC110924963 [Helianthus annuus]|uniref:uncharacterized protein LOC110924963 n=1 Tax=Helianthus annuus TaxID=4232 RepID=UPI000B8F5A9B|nr:uncharacterized protein LOC110924963 [Helianthus annuus]